MFYFQIRCDMANWKPEEFRVGDRVTDPARPAWGVGVVTKAMRLSDLPLPLGGFVTPRPKTVGQRLAIRFEDGRTRTVISSANPLKKV
jgi:hypothetical protein